MVMAQQISTGVACRISERLKAAHPQLARQSPADTPNIAQLRSFGLPERRAECCVNILRQSDEIRARVQQGQPWEEVLAGIKGIGPWTLSVFRIMVLREPDELPRGDVGLQRAIANVYGKTHRVERLGKTWRPLRSIAFWDLWRTL